MKIADIVLIRGVGVISEVIEYVQCSDYSHVAGIVKENEIIEATGFEKTGYEGLDEYKGKADIFTCDSLTDEQRVQIIKYVEKQVGSRYNYFLLFLEGLRYLLNITIPERKFNNHICSTLWADAYRSVGINICPYIKYPSPKDISKSKLLRKIESV